MKEQNIKIPKHLSSAMKIFFKQTCETYELEPHHIHLLTLGCEAKDRATEARRAIFENGMTYIDRYGAVRLRPECQVEAQSKILFTRILRELNLSEEVDTKRPPSLQYGGKK
jgi:hypothetical protein